MNPRFKKILSSGHTQLNIIGALLMTILGFSAWKMMHPFTSFSLFPLACIGYAVFWIVFELTFNRANVPSLAIDYWGRRKIAEIIKKESTKPRRGSYRIIDLGSGRGELTRLLARTLTHAQITGIERARGPYRQSVFLQRWMKLRNLSYQYGDFWSYNCADANAVVFYLNPALAEKIGDKLSHELKAGSLVISHSFPLLGAWIPSEIVHFYSPFRETLYIYRND